MVNLKTFTVYLISLKGGGGSSSSCPKCAKVAFLRSGVATSSGSWAVYGDAADVQSAKPAKCGCAENCM